MKARLVTLNEEEARAKPVLVTTIETESGQALAQITPGLQHNDANIDLYVDEVERHDGASPIAVEDIIETAKAYPPEDVPPADPVDDRVMRVSGLLVEYGRADKKGLKLALSTALKQLRLTRHLEGYDQTTSGRASDALNALAGSRHGYKPARFLYRLTYQTKFERWWTTFGHDDRHTFLKRLRPGPAVRADDVSYWIIVRGAWQCLRPENGIMTVQVNPDIPTDSHPEESMGDDWKVLEGLPQQRIGDRQRQVIKNDVDLLFCSLGYRAKRGRGNLMFGEWVDVAMGSEHSKGKVEKKKNDPDKPKPFEGLRSTAKLLGAFLGVMALFFATLAIMERL